MRTFTDNDAEVTTAPEVTPEADAQVEENAQAESPIETPDNDGTPEPVAPETSTPKLTPAAARSAAETVWNDAVKDILDNDGSPDPVAMASALAPVPTNGRFLKELFGGVMGELAADPDAFDKLSKVALFKNAVAEILEVVPERSDKGASPEAVRSALVERWARAAYVNECLTALGDVDKLVAPDNLTDEELASIAAFSPTKVLVDALDKVRDVLTGVGRKGGGGGTGSPDPENKSDKGDYLVPGNKFEHRGKDGKVTAILVVQPDKSFRMTRANGSHIDYPAGTSASKIATDEAGNSNRNGLKHWALVVPTTES